MWSMVHSRTEVLAEARVIELLLLQGSDLSDEGLRCAIQKLGAPPWVRTLGTCFQWRSAVTGHLMFTVAAPLDPEIRCYDCDQDLSVPTYEGKLKGLNLPQEDHDEIWRTLFTSPAGCWADDEGNSVSLVL